MNCAALRPKPKCAASNLITKRRNPRDYWVDQRVSVYYGPNRPANAVLEPVAEGLLARGLLTVAFLISGAALLAYMSYRLRLIDSSDFGIHGLNRSS